jgi:Phage integrase family
LVGRPRWPNADLRTREHLTRDEVAQLIEAAKGNRHGHRDTTMILLAFRHGLRVAEACDLRWDQVDFKGAVLHERRVKNGTPSTHPIQGDELRALRRLQRQSPSSPFVFVRERGSPFTTAGFARMIQRAAAGAGLELKAHPHNAAPRLRLRPRQQRPRHPADPGMAWTSNDRRHRRLHGAGAEPVQGRGIERQVRCSRSRSPASAYTSGVFSGLMAAYEPVAESRCVASEASRETARLPCFYACAGLRSCHLDGG